VATAAVGYQAWKTTQWDDAPAKAENTEEKAKPDAKPAPSAADDEVAPTIRPDVTLSGGRSGERVKDLEGPPNSIVKGGGERAFETDDTGRVIKDITRDRVKPVTPGQGFGPKRAPTPKELEALDKVQGK